MRSQGALTPPQAGFDGVADWGGARIEFKDLLADAGFVEQLGERLSDVSASDLAVKLGWPE